MLPQHVLLALAAAVSAVPLNINLGAYSPALVVGDGEISFESSGNAAQLMETLASGAANTAGNNNEQQNQQQGERRDIQSIPNLVRDIANEAISKRSAAPEPEPEPVDDSLDLAREAMEWIKRDIAGFREALGYAREAQKDAPKVNLGTPESGVGIQVNAGVNVPANSAANGAPPPRAQKRSEEVEESEGPKMTLVAITEV